MLMNNLSSFKNFFTSSLEAQNEMLTRKFGVTANSGYFNDEALQTSILALYLSLLFGLMSRSVHLAYASVRQEFFNLDLWADMMFTEYPEFYDLAHTSEAFPNAGKKDDILPSSSFSTHQSSPSVPHTMEEIPNTTDHMIVDPPPVTSQEKGKSQVNDPPFEQTGTGTPEEQQQNDEGWQTVTWKKKKSSKKNKTQRQEVLRVMTEHKPASHQKVHEIMVYDVPSTWRPEKIMNELTLWGKMLSISIKTQKKYHSLCVRIELNLFKATAFDRKDWTTDLGGIPVRWFPASWTLKERKE
jgi:hypothetical protein